MPVTDKISNADIIFNDVLVFNFPTYHINPNYDLVYDTFCIFCEKNIKAREMPEIHYLIVYKNSEEKFLDENINKIKNYFEDYLKQVKEAEELVKLKQKMEEEERIKLQKEKEERERFILPKINKFELEEINQNSVIISVPLYGEKEIINKN